MMSYDVAFATWRALPVWPDREDGCVRRFDIRQPMSSNHETIVDLSARGSTSDIAFDPSAPSLFAVGCDDPFVRIFDIRHVACAGAASASGRDHAERIPVVAGGSLRTSTRPTLHLLPQFSTGRSSSDLASSACSQ